MPKYYSKQPEGLYKEIKKKIENSKNPDPMWREMEIATRKDEPKVVKKKKKKDPEEIEEKKEEEVFVESDEWDVKKCDPIEFFDPELSYELTGYRPITETRGLDFNPDDFRGPALTFTKTGSYTTFSEESKLWNDYWNEQYDRCEFGYTVGRYTLTGDNYFFLNFYRLLVAKKNERTGMDDYDEDFPRFFVYQYIWFHYFRLCELLKKDIVALKPRGVGWSEIAASMGSKMYQIVKQSKCVYVASLDKQLNPTLNKLWRLLEWLNSYSNGGMRKLRGVTDTLMHKKASHKVKENDTYVEKGFLSDLEGIIIDHPRKMRGDRVRRLFYEESGSNKDLVLAFILGTPLVHVQGRRVGIKSAWGCLTAGNQVFRADGTPCMIEDLKQEDGILGFKDGKANKEPITWMLPPAEKECIKIYTEFGDIECSLDHPIYTEISDGIYEFVEAKDVIKYKNICICDKVDIWNNDKDEVIEILSKEIFNNHMCAGDEFMINTNNISIELDIFCFNLKKLGIYFTRNDNFLIIKDRRSLYNLSILFNNYPVVFRVFMSNFSRINRLDNNIRLSKILSYEFTGKKPIYNLTAGDSHTYLANGFITHNTGSYCRLLL